MITAVTSILALISQVLPLLGVGGSAGAMITTIISTISSILPLVVSEISLVAPAIKNIINALSENPATTEEQLAQLKALDAQVDAAFEEAAKDTDAGI